MSFSNPNNRAARVFTFAQPREYAAASVPGSYSIPVAGQGVFVFSCADYEQSLANNSAMSMLYSNTDKSDGLRVELRQNAISLFQISTGAELAKAEVGLVPSKRAYYWISLDALNGILYFGIGEARIDNMKLKCTFEKLDKGKVGAFLKNLKTIEYEEEVTHALRYLRDPISDKKVPLVVKNTDELTMDDIAASKYMPKANLSSTGQKLYDNISGKRFILDDQDFPNFSEAIKESIYDPNGWCYKKLEEKATEFGQKPNPDETYLRITLGENNGESPGVPYVMEIWPAGHYSPVHNHAGANAIIRVLHGQIHVTLFPYLGAPEPFGNADFYKEEITWISPVLNQIHRLKNITTDKEPCITIQCYMYDSEDDNHYGYFDYIEDDSSEEGHFEPNSDMEFLEFKMKMKEEWQSRHR